MVAFSPSAATSAPTSDVEEMVMRYPVATFFTAALSLVVAAAAQGQPAQPPAPASPPPYGESINLEQSMKIVEAAMAEAKKNNWLMAISVVGPAGDLVYFAKMDNTQYASVTISQHKARAAATFRRPTKVFEENLGKGPEFIYQLTLDGMIGSQGGVPLVVGGKLIGAIGCSGGLGPQDLQVCTAGVNALK
jgi:glc operon protein GlcG